MANNINIQTITWELQTSRLAQAKAWQERISSFSNYQLPSLLEEAIAPYNSDKHDMMIDTIDLEIGNVKNESELREQLQMALQKSLKKRQHDLLTAEHYNILQALQSYLKHGTLPWYADKKLFGDAALLYVQLIAFSPAQLKTAIRLHDNASAIRLTQLLGTGQQLISFLRHLSEISEDEIQAIVAFIQTTIFAALNNKEINNRAPHRYQTIFTFKALLQYFFVHQILNMKTFLELWWADVIKNQYLSINEQKLLSEFVSREPSFSAAAVSKIYTKQTRRWADELRNIILDTMPGPLAEPKQNETKAADVTTFYVENAGGVLLYIYLKKVFLETGLLNDDLSFVSQESQMQAVRLLEFIICGHYNFKEYDLVLNKVLCGYDIGAPVIEVEDVPGYDISKANRLLLSAVKSWPKIGNTSVEGFRASFLFRNGKLSQETNNWLLYVERKGIDVLMDSLPYPISIIKLPWMKKPLYVQW